ncbi:MAG TPA: hypothetical protein VGT04_10890 [Acidobacteriaceae bacterium]|nr:hypothetical protein [Acidobacteriaceae bacterium]
MTKSTFRFSAFVLIASTLSLVAALAQAGSAASHTSNRFPYLFNNFPWWTDAALRIELKKRVPGLGDELKTGSPAESRVREVLTQLLKQKGIRAEVMTEEPSVNLLSAPRDANAPPTSILFSVLAPPHILVQQVAIENSPSETLDQMNQIASRLQGQPYSETSLWMYKEEMKEALQAKGYLASAVALRPESPKQQQGQYLVPITATITPGGKYYIAAITADGGPLLKGRDLSPYIGSKPGDLATSNPFGIKLIGSLRSMYWSAGYPDVEIQAQPVLDTARALASYHLTVVPGPLYRLRSLKVEGLSDTQQVQARSLLGLKAGDIYNAYAVAMLDHKLSNSPLDGYDLTFSPIEDKRNHVVDLTLSFHKR